MSEESAADRLRAALDLYEVGESMLRQRLRREFPGDDAMLIEERVTEWRLRRPGAENGDFPGPASDRIPTAR